MTYRDEPCAFCELTPIERCPRCHVSVCAPHGLAGTPHCWACRKELKDDLDVARFRFAIHETPPDSSPFRSRTSPLQEAFDRLYAWIRISLASRQVRSTFAGRSPERIAEWRRAAGVRTRGS